MQNKRDEMKKARKLDKNKPKEIKIKFSTFN